MKKEKKISSQKSTVSNKGLRTPIPAPITSLNGIMDFTKTEDGLNIMDFVCLDYVDMEPFIAECKVQAMRDGYVYITERPRRKRNTPLFREDNSSLTLGRDGKYYFVFTMEKRRKKELPDELVRQAKAIAQKVRKNINL